MKDPVRVKLLDTWTDKDLLRFYKIIIVASPKFMNATISLEDKVEHITQLFKKEVLQFLHEKE
jgi:hypothetical protein